MGQSQFVTLLLLQATLAYGIRPQPSTFKRWEDEQVLHPHASADLPDLTNRPIICILTQPGDLAGPGESYLSAGYVKWLESAGARVAPVLFDMSEKEVTRMFHLCNGVLFPGGNYPLKTTTKWFKTAELLHDLAVEADRQGSTYPVLGTCLGLQLLATITTRDEYALEPVEAHNHPAHVTWTDHAASSRMLSHVPDFVRKNLQSLPIAMHNHYYALVDSSFERYPKLGERFNVLSHSQDLNKKTYISMIEAKDYPIMGLAFHNDEKVPYEWTEDLAIPHTREATDAAYNMAAAFVALARKNAHKGPNPVEEDARLIYNWTPEYAGKRDGHDDEELPFQQVYIFNLDKYLASAAA